MQFNLAFRHYVVSDVGQHSSSCRVNIWRRYDPNCDFLEASCAVLVEKVLLTGSVQAGADEMSWDRGYQKQAAATLACR